MLFEFLNSTPTTSKMGHTPSKLGHTRNYSDPKTSTPTVTPRKAPQVPSQPLKLDLKPAVKLDSVVTQSVQDSDAAAVIGTSDADANGRYSQYFLCQWSYIVVYCNCWLMTRNFFLLNVP